MLKFFSQPHMTIYTPIDGPCRAEKKYAVLKFVEVISGQNNPKNSVKIRL
jgi:hypothetical protein